ncbi:MAG: hypothetical protein ACK5M3_12395 [Dysgonomonas sp.]
MNFLIYLGENDYNDATSYYVDIIKEAISRTGNTSSIIGTWKGITKDDYVITINYKSFFFVDIFTECKNIIFWFQGVLPEEVTLSFGKLEGTIKRIVYSRIEKMILKKARLLFFVSDAMLKHFQTKCQYNGDNYIVMPCFNKKISKTSFLYSEKYTNPTFVYAGSLSKWQCIDETLTLYKKIEDNIKGAKLILLTGEQELAKSLVSSKGIENYKIDYIEVDKLDEELKKYKYAFLIRNNIIVNKVSTPTKMNTYLANGLIPIFTDSVDAFADQIAKLQYSICFKYGSNTVFEQIKKMERMEIEPEGVYNEFNNVFETYYNTELYIELIRVSIKKIFATK